MDPDDIVVNSHAKILPRLGGEVAKSRDPDSIDRFLVTVPLRSRPLEQHAIIKATNRELFDLFYQILAADGDLDLELTDAQEEYLLRIGFLAPQRLIPEVVRYSCFLDAGDFADPADLVTRTSPPRSNRLIVNPSLRFVDVGTAFEPLQGRGLSTDLFLSGHPMLWVEELQTSMLSPYWVRGRTIDVARSLIPCEPAPSNLDSETESCFRAAEILVPEDHLEQRAAEVERAAGVARRAHEERGYVILRDVIPPLHIAAMRRYYRRLIENGYVTLGDGQVEKRYTKHNESVSSFWHRQLGSLMSRVLGRPVKPSYCYFVQYEPGSILKRHIDRRQAEYTLSIQVDYDPEPAPGEKTSWPIFVEAKAKAPAEIRLAIGEAALYRGREMHHYRRELPAGRRSTSTFFHYVHAEYEGALR